MGVDRVGGVSGLGCDGATSWAAATVAPADKTTADNHNMAADGFLVLMMSPLLEERRPERTQDRVSGDIGANRSGHAVGMDRGGRPSEVLTGVPDISPD
jgi:hypothetical protein